MHARLHRPEGAYFIPWPWPKATGSDFSVRSRGKEAILVFKGTDGSCHGLGEEMDLAMFHGLWGKKGAGHRLGAGVLVRDSAIELWLGLHNISVHSGEIL